MASLLDRFSEDELQELLLEARRKRTGKRVDYDNMSDAERQAVNRTTQPATFKTVHIEYPKMLYGMHNGQLMSATVGDRQEEQILKAKYAYDWQDSPLKHGVETLPEAGHGITPMPFTLIEAPKLQGGLSPEAFGQAASEAIKRGPGRPKKNAA